MDTKRPLVPNIDPVKFLQSMIDDTPASGSLASILAQDDGPPRLFSPYTDRPASSPPSSSLPLLYYFPGIDGTGLAAYRQFPSLSQAFDLRAFAIPPSDRSSFEQIVQTAKEQLSAEVAQYGNNRPVYILGESFGGLVCLALAAQCPDIVDRVILVNPATSFTSSMWPAAGPLLTVLPSEVYRLLPFALSPLITNPVSMAMHGVDTSKPPLEQASDILYNLIDLVPELAALRTVLPAPTLAFRLQLLAQGSTAVQSTLSNVQQRVLLLVGENDFLIPSKEEAPRLAKALPRCRSVVLPGRSHALLQEAGFDLVTFIKTEGFYAPTRKLSNDPARAPSSSSHDKHGHGSSTQQDASSKGNGGSSRMGSSVSAGIPLSSSFDGRGKAGAIARLRESSDSMQDGTHVGIAALSDGSSDPMHEATSAAAAAKQHQRKRTTSSSTTTGVNFGKPAPVQLPTETEVQKATEGGVDLLKRLVSPVYYSTDSTGRVQLGLGAIPTTRPLLFVGNHQMFATDMPLMIEQFLVERNMLLRGLAHPIIFGAGFQQEQQQSSSRGRGRGRDGSGDTMAFSNFLQTYGAVPVSGRNLYALLAQGEAALLYPGGVREAYKNREDAYKLMWPEKAEFVRMAAKFGATIIPFAAVGADDGITQVLSPRELLALPVLGDWLRSQQRDIPQARKGVSAAEVSSEAFVAPLIAPSVPKRYYFLFQRPISTSPALADDKAAMEQLYTQVRCEVEAGFDYLLDKRQQDPYRELLPRLLYEASWGGSRQAPSFQP